ncbi:hypothetical protein [Archaeoglobus sp.]
MSSRLRVSFDGNIAEDHVICWGITVALLKKSLFGKTAEERKRVIRKKVSQAIEELGIADIAGSNEFRVSMLSAWVRYYVFKLETDGRSYVLNILSPNSPIKSFRKILDPLKGLFEKYSKNIARPLAYTDEFMLQEWIDGVPLSEFRDGDIMKSDPDTVRMIEKSIFRTAKLLYQLWKDGYIYTPWEDYEVMYRNGDIILLDVTRFSKRADGKFFDYYYGAPFTPPDVIKPSDNPVHRLYYRGVSEKDYFGVDRKKYLKLFLMGIASECKSFEEFSRICPPELNAESIWTISDLQQRL